jgi:mersacidin/lichenicidin family type 2 lantibiotic
MADIDIARALKDKNYFNSLTEEQKRIVRRANPAGDANLSDADLDTVSGGLGGGEETEASTSSSMQACHCSVSTGGSCSCGC